jgi:peptidoglycan/xylan/chitin deacetylase (PgdA/CDA1 family)
MSRDGLVRFGAHTATHQILTRTTPDDAQREIERSVAAVATLVDFPSRGFAYPNGEPGDFDAAVTEVVRRAGIEYGLSTIPGPVGSDADFYAIPRYSIGDHPLARFAGLVHHARHVVRGSQPRIWRNRFGEFIANGEDKLEER